MPSSNTTTKPRQKGTNRIEDCHKPEFQERKILLRRWAKKLG